MTAYLLWQHGLSLIKSAKLKSHQRVFFSCWGHFRLMEHAEIRIQLTISRDRESSNRVCVGEGEILLDLRSTVKQ